MLTGRTDTNTVISAVNEECVFRFLTTPCSPEILAGTIIAGIEQFRLITAERELLEKTLTGSIKIITDILALVNPIASSQRMSPKAVVAKLLEQPEECDPLIVSTLGNLEIGETGMCMQVVKVRVLVPQYDFQKSI
jgi:hypothetical protein